MIFLGSFSKTLAANLRVGYIAAAPEVAKALADQKMLVGMTSPELNERVVYKVLTEGHYRRRAREDRAHAGKDRSDDAVATPAAGMFLWANTGVDSDGLVAAGHEAGFLLTPGSLFSPHQSPTIWMRFNIANCGDPALPGCLEQASRRSA